MSNRTGSSSSSNPYENYSLSEMLSELREIREEAARMNSGSRENTSNETLGTVLTELRMMREAMKDIKEEVGRIKTEQGNQKKVLESLHRNVVSLNCLPDIKRQIFGKWRYVNNEKRYFSAKFEDGHFFMKWNNLNSFEKYTLGVKHQNGIMTTVENNKLVQRTLTNNGEETRRDVFHFENERVIQVGFEPGKTNSTWTYERVGDPQF